MQHRYPAERPDFYQNHALNMNGSIHSSQPPFTRLHDGNVLGASVGSDQQCLLPNMQFSGTQDNCTAQHSRTSFQLGIPESPVNFDFFAGQKAMMNARQSGEVMIQKQQPGFSDVQLLLQQQQQQQLLYKQMLEYQQQQMHQLEGHPQNEPNQSLIMKQQIYDGGGSLPVPFAYPSPVGDPNWARMGVPVTVQGSSGGMPFSSNTGQSSQSPGSVHHWQTDQSLYGVPVSSTIGTSRTEIDGSGTQQTKFINHVVNAQDSSNQFNLEGGVPFPRQEFETRNGSQRSPLQGFVNETVMDNHRPTHKSDNMNCRSRLARGAPSSSGSLQVMTPENVHSSSSCPALDPTEEKILFGTDANIWDAIGKDIVSDNSAAGSNSFSSFQCGAWTALMQSALVEVNGTEGAWNAATSSSSTQNKEIPVFNENSERKKMVRPENNRQQTGPQQIRSAVPRADSSLRHQQQPLETVFPRMDFSQHVNQNPPNNTLAQQLPGDVNGWKGAKPTRRSMENTTCFLNPDLGRNAELDNAAAAADRTRGLPRTQQPQNFDSKKLKRDLRTANSLPVDDKRDASNAAVLPPKVRENVWMDVSAPTFEKSHAPAWKPGVQKFHYHPMGISEVDTRDYNNEAERFIHLRSQHSTRTSRKLEPPLSDQNAASIDKAPLARTDQQNRPEVETGIGKLQAPRKPDTCVAMNVPNINAYPSQSMLDLLHKVDQSRDIFNTGCSFSRSNNVPSSSQGFGLQLAPPSQRFSSSMNQVCSPEQRASSANDRHSLSSSFESLPQPRKSPLPAPPAKRGGSESAQSVPPLDRNGPTMEAVQKPKGVSSTSTAFHSSWSTLPGQPPPTVPVDGFRSDPAVLHTMFRDASPSTTTTTTTTTTSASAENEEAAGPGLKKKKSKPVALLNKRQKISMEAGRNHCTAPSWLDKQKQVADVTAATARNAGSMKTKEKKTAGDFSAAAEEARIASSAQCGPSHTTPKKHKTAPRLIPWHRELSRTSQGLSDASTQEGRWARRLRRLVVDDADKGDVMVKPKRRLATTTQLMQLLFRPPPRAALSADVVFFAARLALGDACRLASPAVEKAGEGDDQLSVLEGLLVRNGNLERRFSQVEGSVLDIRLECEELERFATVNRFARFHGRAGGLQLSSSSPSQKHQQHLFLQRYVTALPMPRDVPDMETVQCLSL